MKILLVHPDLPKQHSLNGSLSQLLERSYSCETERFAVLAERAADICQSASSADFLVTTDLAGFEYTTLLDGIFYNTLTCKQVHFLLSDDLPNEPILDHPLSIAMFFYCTSEARRCELSLRHPQLPFLKAIDGWSTRPSQPDPAQDAGLLLSSIREALSPFLPAVP